MTITSGRNVLQPISFCNDEDQDLKFTIPKPTSVSTSLLTRIDELARTNLPPMDSETPSLSAVLAESKARLKQITFRISSGRSAHLLKELHDARERELESIHRLNGILSNGRLLPPEILLEIFAFCMETIFGRFVIDLTQRDNILWRLGQVCSRWRALVSQHMHRYWSSIVIDLNRLSEPQHIAPGYVQYLLEICLRRSANHSLTFEVVGCPTHCARLKQDIFSLLVSQSDRWKKVTFRNIPYSLLSGHLSHLQHIPRLENLTICLPKHDTPNTAPESIIPHDTPINLLSSSSRLQYIYLYGFDLGTLSNLRVPWSTLPDISGMYSCDTMLEVFNLATSMSSSFICMGTKTPPQNPPTHIVHPSLSDFDLDGFLWILDYLTLPTLQRFCAHAWEPSQFSIIPSFIRRHPSISELRLWVEECSPDESIMLDIYQACTEITSLKLGVDMHDAYRLFPMLTVDESSSKGCLLPKLIDLELDAGTVHADLAALLIKMLESRNRSPSLTHHCAKIESLTVYVSMRTLETSLDKQLQVFRDKGMRIVLEESAFPEPTEEEDLVMY
ncbi:hypothetical protein D9758_010435 [Tetrapyrgos nigripes]|uniref:F-box domain-containing protein n=1 Tax=Tetrapyrgos nigripes TaxID=182062 RepID=A0A8H5FQG2_9AGAR|nr:hypothetical protein D9758_010435 [Tetrapyrgos nigripes]